VQLALPLLPGPPRPLDKHVMHSARLILRVALSALLGRVGGEDGQTMAEYAMIIGVVALVVVVAALTLSSNIAAVFTSVSHHM
jgi:Flp pilus assembly pilin Flp